MIYNIHESNMERLQKKLNTIQNKCERYGCSFSFDIVGEEYRSHEQRNDETKEMETVTERFITVEVEGVAKLGDWEFIATINHVPNGGGYSNIIRTFSDKEIPVYFRTCEPHCDHCNSNRGKTRRDTYIIYNKENGAYRQVGTNCLADYIGVDATSYTQFISYFDHILEYDSVFTGNTREEHYVQTREYLLHVAECIRLWGYVSRKLAREREENGDRIPYVTSERAASIMYRFNKYDVEDAKKAGFNPEHEGNSEKINVAMEWLNSIEISNDNTFMLNLKTLCNLEYFPMRNTGTVAALFVCYMKAMDLIASKKAEQEKKEQSQWFGVVGEKFTALKLHVVRSFAIETKFGNMYINKMVDDNNTVFVWGTGKMLEGDIILKGTIKEHSVYNGEKQTELTRCKIV